MMNNVQSDGPVNLLDYDPARLGELFEAWGEKPYRARQILRWIHQYGNADFGGMTNLSKSLREKLALHAVIVPPKLVHRNISEDGTCKWVLAVTGGSCIEMVYIPEGERGTLCVSSQVGCALNCSFCFTARQGFQKNLTLAEIIGQIWLAVRELSSDTYINSGSKVTNVVFMGMGEPLLNLDAVIAGANLMMADDGYGLSKYRVTVSTSGLVPQMRQLAVASDVALAVSLHAPNNILRNQLVPLNKKYPLEMLMSACRRYFPEDSKRKVTMEYVMLQEVNDSDKEAKQLVNILQGVPCKVNLIPFNPFPGAPYICSSEKRITRFQRHLMDAGFITTVRRTRGGDIDAACGQLAGQVLDKTKRSQRYQQQLLASNSKPSLSGSLAGRT